MEFENLSLVDRKIIVGIDFGTTYSGVAWAETRHPDRRIAITTWPISETNREAESSDKVPTQLWYKDNKRHWGFAIPPNAPPEEILEWFKLDLDPSLQSMGVAANNAVARGGREVEELVTDYVSAIGEHLQYMLREKLGEGLMKCTPLEFVVTVPAIWSDLAKQRTIKACQMAPALSLDNDAKIHLVAEPEAAAIYALRGLDPHGLGVGDSFVICDAGGGTVDLISYTITKLHPVLEVEELTVGTGGLCGSTFINSRFSSFLTAKLGDEEGFDDEVLAEAMEKFEKTIKRQFTMGARPGDIYMVPVGGLANNKALGINRGRFSLKASDLKTIFDPVVQEAISLVQDQIKSSRDPIKAVLLLGGFGSSTYLKERLREVVPKTTAVIQPPNAWLAVVQGAVMKGLALSAPQHLTTVRVQNRKARKHYGVRLHKQFNEEKHHHIRQRRYWSKYDGHWRIDGMTWFLRRGDPVPEDKPHYQSVFFCRPVSDGLITRATIQIYADRTSKEAPIAVQESVELLCDLTIDLSHIPRSGFKEVRGKDGAWYYKVATEIEVIYHSASTQYTLIYNGQRFNTVTSEYV
ncbi:hypothetical protein OQA88_2075 [Cercophora sp. LCS_1]